MRHQITYPKKLIDNIKADGDGVAVAFGTNDVNGSTNGLRQEITCELSVERAERFEEFFFELLAEEKAERESK